MRHGDTGCVLVGMAGLLWVVITEPANATWQIMFVSLVGAPFFLRTEPELEPEPEKICEHAWVPVTLLWTGELVNHICTIPGCDAEKRVEEIR